MIKKEGEVLGLGKTLTLKKDFNRDYFKEIDVREFKQLTLNAKKQKYLPIVLLNRITSPEQKSLKRW